MAIVFNPKSPAVKRLMREAEELRNATEEYYAQPLDDNLFEWHFTVRGPPKTDFDGGIYHGRIIFPADYPMKPPSIILLTPNGRFDVNKKICLSISGHHPESWQPSWSIRTTLLAIIGFMPTHGNGAIGSLDYSPAERQTLAHRSRRWHCAECGSLEKILKEDVVDVLSGENETEVHNEYCSEKVIIKEDNSDMAAINLARNVDIRPQFSFTSNVDSVLDPFQHSGSSNLAHCMTSSDQASFQTPTRQRMFPPMNDQEYSNSSPVTVERLVRVGANSHPLFTGKLSTACICVIAILLGILTIRRLCFCN